MLTRLYVGMMCALLNADVRESLPVCTLEWCAHCCVYVGVVYVGVVSTMPGALEWCGVCTLELEW